MLNIKWGAIALEDFKQAMLYIEKVNSRAATEVAQKIWDMTQQLSVHPGIGRPGRVLGTRELVVGTPYIVPYRVSGDSIEIIRVLHSSRKWPKHL